MIIRNSGLKGVAKKVVPRETLKKIKKVSNKHEREELYKHSIKINLERRMSGIEELIKRYEKTHDVFHLFAKSNLLNLKIKYFYVTHNKKDLKIALKILRDVERELENVSKLPNKRLFEFRRYY